MWSWPGWSQLHRVCFDTPCAFTRSCSTFAYHSHIHPLRTRAALPIRTLLARSPCAEEQPPRRPPGASEAGEGSGRAPPYPPSHSGTLFAGRRDRVKKYTVDGRSLWGCSLLPPPLPIGMRLRSRCRTWREPAFGRWPKSALRSSADFARKLETRSAHMRKVSNGKSIALLCACASQTPKEI